MTFPVNLIHIVQAIYFTLIANNIANVKLSQLEMPVFFQYRESYSTSYTRIHVTYRQL